MIVVYHCEFEELGYGNAQEMHELSATFPTRMASVNNRGKMG